MTPEQISAIVAVATILKTVGTLPFGLVLIFIIAGPWLGMLMASNAIAKRTSQAAEIGQRAIAAANERSNQAISDQNARIEKATNEFREHVNTLVSSQEKRFEAVVRMYENNVEVVKNYHALANDLTGIITLSTRTLEGLVSKIDNNQFCPIVRKETGK